MSYLAAILSAIVGLVLAGPFGAILGVLIWAAVKLTGKETPAKS